MNTFHITTIQLPHDGIIPGARGHKKVVIPRGTTVHTITHGGLFFWAAYLDRDAALSVRSTFEDSIAGRGRRPIDLATLLTWNFRRTVPTRISRPKP